MQHTQSNTICSTDKSYAGTLAACENVWGRSVTIGELITQNGAQFKVFDMGRRIRELSLSEFSAFEAQTAVYPSPYLSHAWLGLMSWDATQPGHHHIWFIKLPLDEQGLIQPAARDAFVGYWLRVMQHPKQEHGEAPFSYQPDPHRMAYFHALAIQALEQASSKYYQATRNYLAGDLGYEQWQMLGLQGLAELVSRLDEDGNSELLAKAMAHLPSQPRTVLLGFLENVAPDQQLTSAINDALAQVVAKSVSAVELAAFARALSNSVNSVQRRDLLAAILQHELRYSVELLAAISSRSWADLHDELLLQFLECLARNEQGAGAFNALVTDLLSMPGMRQQFINALASPQRSDELAKAFEVLLASVSNK